MVRGCPGYRTGRIRGVATMRSVEKRIAKTLVGRLAGDRSGVAAAEFALLLPVITLMLCSSLQYGMLYYSYNVMTNAARNAARSLATGTATEAQAALNVKASLPGWIPANQITVTPRNAVSTGTGNVTARIAVPSRYATTLPLGPMPETLDITVTMQNQT